MLEDSPMDATIISKTLSNAFDDFELTVVNNGQDYQTKLSEKAFDVILCDYQLPDFDAVKALHLRN